MLETSLLAVCCAVAAAAAGCETLASLFFPGGQMGWLVVVVCGRARAWGGDAFFCDDDITRMKSPTGICHLMFEGLCL